MTHRKNWVRATRQLSILKRIVLLTDACQLNLNANTIHRCTCWMHLCACWWITNEWLLERLHAASLTTQWSSCLADQPHRLTRWVLDGLQICLIGSQSSTCSSSPGWSESSLVPQNVWELWLALLQTGMSGDGAVSATRTMAECLHYVKQSDRHTCLTQSELQKATAPSHIWNTVVSILLTDSSINEHFWHLNLCKHFAHPAETSREAQAPAVSAWWWWGCFFRHLIKKTKLYVFRF